MRGFEDSTNPVQLNLDPVVTNVLGLPANVPVAIDTASAEATDYGILATVSDTRYFVPWSKVYMVRQVQPVAPVAQAPVITQPATPVVPSHD